MTMVTVKTAEHFATLIANLPYCFETRVVSVW